MCLTDTVCFSHTAREVICLTFTAGNMLIMAMSSAFIALIKLTYWFWMIPITLGIVRGGNAHITEGFTLDFPLI